MTTAARRATLDHEGRCGPFASVLMLNVAKQKQKMEEKERAARERIRTAPANVFIKGWRGNDPAMNNLLSDKVVDGEVKIYARSETTS